MVDAIYKRTLKRLWIAVQRWTLTVTRVPFSIEHNYVAVTKPAFI